MAFLVLRIPEETSDRFFKLSKEATKDYQVKFSSFDQKEIWYGYQTESIDYNEIKMQPIDPNLDTQKEGYIQYFNQISNVFNSSKPIEKIVAARTKKVPISTTPDTKKYYDLLKLSFPNTYLFHIYISSQNHWMGASPELVGQLEGAVFKTISLAGTIGKNQLFTEKEVEEQSIVSNQIYDLLKSYSNNNTIEAKNQILSFGSLQHILSKIQIKLNSPSHFEKIVEKIHPSAALSGYPKEAAIEFILKNEPIKRGFYTGLCSLNCSAQHKISFAFLRCFRLYSNALLFYAGGGITPVSDLETEWNETEDKIKQLVNALGIND